MLMTTSILPFKQSHPNINDVRNRLAPYSCCLSKSINTYPLRSFFPHTHSIEDDVLHAFFWPHLGSPLALAHFAWSVH